MHARCLDREDKWTLVDATKVGFLAQARLFTSGGSQLPRSTRPQRGMFSATSKRRQGVAAQAARVRLALTFLTCGVLVVSIFLFLVDL